MSEFPEIELRAKKVAQVMREARAAAGDSQSKRVAYLADQIVGLREDVVEVQLDHFFDMAHEEEDGPMKGWHDSMARSTIRDLGDALVKAGRLERHPSGVGRRWFYRYIKESATA